jgi:uncharacterized membrane protein
VPTVAPTRTDPVAANGSEFLGGPLGRWAVPGRPARALQTILGIGALTFALGALRTVPCAVDGWSVPARYQYLCYSDIPILYVLRGIADGGLPYLDASGEVLEYPVLTGMFAWFAGLFTASDNSTGYYWLTAALLLVCFLIALAATAMTVPHRVWDGLLMALAPSVLLASLINWDWWAVGLTAVGLLAWSRSRPVVAGVLLGLAVSAKFYPLLLFGPLLLLCWRRERMAAFLRAFGAAALTWLAVNLPFMLTAWEGWSTFFQFSSERGQDFGSLWLALTEFGYQVPADALNLVAAAALAVCCLGIAGLILLAPQPPRLAQVAFLVVAAFIVTNKVYSPQFVLWLLPLAVLARPRWRDFLIWQATEVVYYVAVWWYLVDLTPDTRGLPSQWYAVAILVHVAGVVYLAAVVVRDIVHPELDPVRTDPLAGTGVEGPAAWDDPGGGVLDGAPDRRAYSRPST